ncbi:MAG TPA: ribosome-associated translation inhibitor RaiA [Rugosimonospora sp.]
MDIVIKGRNVEVPDHYRQHVADKLHKIERYDQKIIRVEVELSHERNPRQSDHCQRVEVTFISRGPVVRAEACAADFYRALDHVAAKLDARLRRAADRRRVHRGHHAPVSVAAATSGLPLPELSTEPIAAQTRTAVRELDDIDEDRPWHIAREKEHRAVPMTVDDALFEMELVGHNFFLYLDKESGRPCVVYRRRAYDYGVISLTA